MVLLVEQLLLYFGERLARLVCAFARQRNVVEVFTERLDPPEIDQDGFTFAVLVE
jgi:hypothetical protein